jgi:hypothetical protein
MDTIFFPPKNRGLVFHTAALLCLSLGCILSIFYANRVEVGPGFIISLMFLLLFLLPIPVLAYRLYALQRACYQLSPEGIRLYWGLRVEEIPMEKILWLSSDTHLERPILPPRMRWPGSVVGVRQVKGGEVEYMASQAHSLILIATPGKMYAISPENPEVFIQTFHRQAEIGTFTPMPARSIYPTFLLGHVWANHPARFTVLAGLFLSLTFLIWLPLTPSAVGLVPFANGQNIESLAVSQTQILLLPIVNTLFFLSNFLLGLFFFRRPESQPLAYLLWVTSIFTTLLFFSVFYFF